MSDSYSSESVFRSPEQNEVAPTEIQPETGAETAEAQDTQDESDLDSERNGTVDDE